MLTDYDPKLGFATGSRIASMPEETKRSEVSLLSRRQVSISSYLAAICLAPVCLVPVCLVMVALAGCQQSDLAPVIGKVTFKGEPIKKGYIIMEPFEGRSSRGSIVQGEIVDIHTYKMGDGVRVGNHKVAIISFVREPVGMEVPPSVIPLRYRDPGASGLTAVVEAGKTNQLLFELED